MTARVLPASMVTVTTEDMTLDLVCFEYARATLGDARQAGNLRGYVEATYEANPGLADAGILLPLGASIRLPEFTIASEDAYVRLWD